MNDNFSKRKIIASRLKRYDQQRMAELGQINLILYKPKSFLKQRKYQRTIEYLEQYFGLNQAGKQLKQLVEYYRFYCNSPLTASLKHFDLMNNYWSKSKQLFYRKIKRQLQLEQEQQPSIASQINIENTGQSQHQQSRFQLPEEICSLQNSFLNDPDATLKYILTTITHNNKIKEQTRQASRIGQFQERVHKSHRKGKLRTNPSNVGTTSSNKKTYKQSKHKSLSNEKKKTPTKQKKLNVNSSCQRLASKPSENHLNYQRRNADPKPQKKKKQVQHHKQKQSSLCKKYNEAQLGKKHHEKSEAKSSKKKLSAGKAKEMESQKVKTAINKARDKIKAEKKIVLKKYIQDRQSFTRSNDSRFHQHKKHKK